MTDVEAMTALLVAGKHVDTTYRGVGKTTAVLKAARILQGRGNVAVVVHYPKLVDYARDLWRALHNDAAMPLILCSENCYHLLRGRQYIVLVDEAGSCKGLHHIQIHAAVN